MITLLDARPSAQDVPVWQATPVRRLTVADRIALRVGLALVLWARRPLAEDPEALRRRFQVAADTDRRLRDAGRTAGLLLPPR